MQLETTGLTRRFGGLTAVNNVSLKVERGELLGIIGPNGSGKTTLFNMLTGFLAQTSGTISYQGRRIDGRTPEQLVRQGIARSFQAVRFHRESTVRETVWTAQSVHLSLSGIFRSMSSKNQLALRQEIDRILEDTWLMPYANKLARELPFGLVRQLEIARALATRPKILLLDEPASGMNPSETERLSADIRRLNEGGLTIVLVEHNMEMVMNLCRRIVALNFGEVIASGTPSEVRHNPEVIKAYFGTKAAIHA